MSISSLNTNFLTPPTSQQSTKVTRQRPFLASGPTIADALHIRFGAKPKLSSTGGDKPPRKPSSKKQEPSDKVTKPAKRKTEPSRRLSIEAEELVSEHAEEAMVNHNSRDALRGPAVWLRSLLNARTGKAKYSEKSIQKHLDEKY